MQFLTKLFSVFGGENCLCVFEKEVGFIAEGKHADVRKHWELD